jgi:hypothetical protein
MIALLPPAASLVLLHSRGWNSPSALMGLSR